MFAPLLSSVLPLQQFPNLSEQGLHLCVLVLDEFEDLGWGHVIDRDLFGGVLGGEVAVLFELVDWYGPGVVGGAALAVEMDELGEVLVGDGFVGQPDDTAAMEAQLREIRSEEHTSELQSPLIRSEERRVGKECRIGCRSRWSPYH